MSHRVVMLMILGSVGLLPVGCQRAKIEPLPPPTGPFRGLSVGMTQPQVFDLVGVPKTTTYHTAAGRAVAWWTIGILFIPIGPDPHYSIARYEGKGRLYFRRDRSGNILLIKIEEDPAEKGYL